MSIHEDLSSMGRSIYEHVDKEMTKAKCQIGTVTALSGNQVVCTVGTSSLTLSRLGGWTPVVGDVVLIETSIQNWVVLGKILP